MKITTKITSCLIVASVGLYSASQLVSADVVGSGASCVAVPLSSSKEVVRVCPKDFPALWKNMESIDGTYIRITGYVADVHGSPYLFASKDLYIYSSGKGGLALEFESGEEQHFDEEVRGDHAITVVGKLTAGGSGIQPESLGRLSVIGKHYWPQEMPGERPKLPPKP